MADSESSTEPVSAPVSEPVSAPTLTTDEKVDKIIEILKSSFSQFEYDDNKYRWTCDMLKIREAINEL